MTLRPNCPVCDRPFPSGDNGETVIICLIQRCIKPFKIQASESASPCQLCSGQQLNLDIAMDAQIRRLCSGHLELTSEQFVDFVDLQSGWKSSWPARGMSWIATQSQWCRSCFAPRRTGRHTSRKYIVWKHFKTDVLQESLRVVKL